MPCSCAQHYLVHTMPLSHSTKTQSKTHALAKLLLPDPTRRIEEIRRERRRTRHENDRAPRPVGPAEAPVPAPALSPKPSHAPGAEHEMATPPAAPVHSIDPAGSAPIVAGVADTEQPGEFME